MLTQEHLAANPRSRQAESAAERAPNGTMDECLRCADEILLLLSEESTALKSFNGEALTQLLARKEHLFNELKGRIDFLGTEKHSSEKTEFDKSRAPLKDRLHQIIALNQGNRAFIENTLSYYQDFVSCLCPSVYGRGQEGRPERAHVAMRGVAFTKEV